MRHNLCPQGYPFLAGGLAGDWYKQAIIIQCVVPTGTQGLEASVVRSGQRKLPEKSDFLKQNEWLAVSHLGNYMAKPRREGPIHGNALWTDPRVPLKEKQKDLKMTKYGIK